MKIKMIVFDMAGTTIDEDNIVYKTLHKSINQFGVSVDLPAVLEIGAGQEKLAAITDIVTKYGTTDDLQKAGEMFAYFKHHLKSAYEEFDIKPMQNAQEVLTNLRSKNRWVVLNTGYDRSTAEFILNKINWKLHTEYDLLVTATEVKNNRPAADMIQFAMNVFAISDPKEVVKIGDSKIDIEEGKNAHCLYSIGITTGAQTKSQLAEANPDAILDNLNELSNFLNI
jgi:phosphonatase-like hydrolase